MIAKYALIKVMKQLLTTPAKRYSVREAAEKSRVSVFAAKKALDYLFQKCMLTLERVGRTYQYQANLGNYLTRQWKIIFTIEEIDDARIVDKILGKTKNVMSIILYGSTAVGKDDEKSDIDIIVIADVSHEKKRQIYSIAEGTAREITVQVYTPAEWRKKAVVDKIFYEQVIIDSIILYGEKPVVL